MQTGDMEPLVAIELFPRGETGAAHLKSPMVGSAYLIFDKL